MARAPKPLSLTTKELSKKTWPDFERLFSHGNGWDFCWCMHFHRLSSLPQKEFRTRADRSVRNHKDKKGLVEQNRAHGILVYSKGEPIGWCQFGPKDELPRIDQSRKYQELENDSEPLWRITCFVVEKKHRKSGVGSAALNAALEAIKNKGGGVVQIRIRCPEPTPLRPLGTSPRPKGGVLSFALILLPDAAPGSHPPFGKGAVRIGESSQCP